MPLKVLVTCPPMLRQIDKFREAFSSIGIEITAPNLLQTLTVKQLLDLVPKHDGWIIGDDPATAEVFEAGKSGRLKAAVKWGIGVDNIDFFACERLGIPIANTPGMFGAEVADLAMCYILGLARDVFLIDREVRQGGWPKPAGISLAGKTLGIVGLGDIGRNIAKRAYAHDLNIGGWDPYATSLPDYITLHNEWPSGVNACDFIVFACALTSKNHYMFDEKILAYLKPGVRVVNVSRGPLIKESALLKGLANGSITSAALDVFEVEPLVEKHKILDHPRCILGSHNGSNTIDAVIRASNEAIKLLHEMLTRGVGR
ncbi:phosphoglycerate dehydrogenase [Gammaproteobacteria bacterium]|nr:phosphoglycerate dehydrogenase [Gammaproteobacteria bacterium]